MSKRLGCFELIYNMCIQNTFSLIYSTIKVYNIGIKYKG